MTTFLPRCLSITAVSSRKCRSAIKLPFAIRSADASSFPTSLHGDDHFRYFSTTQSSSISYQLYQYQICPFSNMAKAVLTYQQIPFQSIEVNPLTKSELKFSPNYHKVPIVVVKKHEIEGTAVEQQQWNGTEEILPYFGNEISNDNDNGFDNSPSSLQWQDYARNQLAPLLYPNLCNTLGNSVRAFSYIHNHNDKFSIAQRYAIQYIGAIAMYLAASKIKQKYNIDDVQKALDDTLQKVELALESVQKDDNDVIYLRSSSSSSANSQQQPHLGDLCVYGVLKGLEGLSIFDDIMTNNRYSKIQQWYTNMNTIVENKKQNVQ